MKINTEKLVDSILNNLDHVSHVKASDIPNIPLYMDQVTTFMDTHLASSKRYPDDKILTKTMINNYAKNDLLPAPDKKKYSREHLLVMLFIYYFKSFLSITDIQTLMNPLTEKYFQNDEGINLEFLYTEVFKMEESQLEHLKENIREMYKTSKDTFSDVSEEEQEFLQHFSFICLLSFDVYMKKQMIERLIDQLPKPNPKKKK